MWQRVGELLLVVLILSDGLRKQSKVEVGTNSSLQLEVSDSSLRSTISSTLDELDVKPIGILVDMMKGIGNFDWNDEIGPQMKELVTSSVVGLGQTIADAIHPVLGIAFSIFAGLLGLYDTDQSSTMIQEILEQVDKMISGKLTEYHVTTTVKSGLTSAADQVNQASGSGNWQLLPDLLTPRFTDVFFPCSDGISRSDCQGLWRGKYSANAMVYEIHFLELMISSAAEVVRWKGAIAGLKTFMLKTKDMAKLATQHYDKLREVRADFGSGEHGLQSGFVNCYGMRGNRRCRVDGATDLWRELSFCVQAERYPSAGQSLSSLQNSMQVKLDNCFQAEKVEITGELEFFKMTTDAILATATKMYEAFPI